MRSIPGAVSAPGTGPVGRARSMAAVAALAFALFAYGTVQNLPIGLLPQIASSLDVSESSVGLLVTGYGLVVAGTAVPLTHATRRVRRRRLLPVLLSIFAAATLASALTPTFAVLLAAHVVIALTHAVILSVLAVTATSMFPVAVRAKVVGALFLGIPLASAVGVPAGVWLGQQTEWRMPYLVMSVLSVIGAVAVAILLPSAPAARNPVSRAPHPSRSRFTLLIAAVVLAVAGLFTFFTYVAVFLTEVADLPAETVSLVLLLNGLAGLAGSAVSGALSGRSARATMAGTVALLSAGLAALAAWGAHPVVALAAVALLGLAMTAMFTAAQSRILRIAPGSVDLASATNSAAINAGIAAGAFLGGRLLDAHGPQVIAFAGALLACASLIVLLAERPEVAD